MITWETNEYGRSGELRKLNADRNNPDIPALYRKMADDAHGDIVKQLKDKPLMNLRRRLIQATQAGDTKEANKIQLIMRDYRSEEKEHGDYEL